MNRGMTLNQMISGSMGGDEPSPQILPEAAIMRMREFAEAHSKGNPFKVGDIVTPRKGGDVNGAGKPHVVIEILDIPIRNFEATERTHPSSNNFGKRMDIRVLSVSSDCVTPHWIESWTLEPYTGEGS